MTNLVCRDNPIQCKSYDFALRVTQACRRLIHQEKEYVLSRQLLRSGTSIGANVEEAIGGESRKDFQHKMSVAHKEARETHYWLRLLRDSNYLSEGEAADLVSSCEELIRISGSIIRTLKTKRDPNNS